MFSLKKKKKTGEECKAKVRKVNTAIARYVGGTTDSWACSLHWTRIYRELNTFCACPLPARSKEFHHQNIPQRMYKIFHLIGKILSCHRPGIRWYTSCRKSADDLFKREQGYSLLKKVLILFDLIYYKKVDLLQCIHIFFQT